MPKLLLLNPQAELAGSGALGGSQWTLPEDTDVEAVRKELQTAIAAHGPVTVRVLLPGGGGLDTLLTVNGALLTSVAVVEVAAPPPEEPPDEPPGPTQSAS